MTEISSRKGSYAGYADTSTTVFRSWLVCQHLVQWDALGIFLDVMLHLLLVCKLWDMDGLRSWQWAVWCSSVGVGLAQGALLLACRKLYLRHRLLIIIVSGPASSTAVQPAAPQCMQHEQPSSGQPAGASCRTVVPPLDCCPSSDVLTCQVHAHSASQQLHLACIRF